MMAWTYALPVEQHLKHPELQDARIMGNWLPIAVGGMQHQRNRSGRLRWKLYCEGSPARKFRGLNYLSRSVEYLHDERYVPYTGPGLNVHAHGAGRRASRI